MFSKKINIDPLIKDYIELGNKFFLIGIFFLPSALPIGGLFLLLSLVIAFINIKENLFNNGWNYIFLIWIIAIVLNSSFHYFIDPSNTLLTFEKSLIWVNLFNWIPIFFAYLGFQIYLKTEKQLIFFQRFLIAGTIPVIASIIMQKFFYIYGPFETLFGTIVWFNYNFSHVSRVTGLFNNPNYLATWLVMCLPFALTLIRFEKNNYANKIFLYIINFLIIYFAFSTASRNAVIGIMMSLILLIERKKLIYFSIILLGSFLIFGYLLPTFLNLNLPDIIDLSSFNRISSKPLNINNPRLLIWQNSIQFIIEKPFLGWGGGTFPHVFSKLGNVSFAIKNYQHTHNILFELAYNFGIPIASLISITIIKMTITGFKKVFTFKNLFVNSFIYKPFIASLLVFFAAHLTDITYFDGKISIIFSVLLASLKNIIDKKTNLSYVENKY